MTRLPVLAICCLALAACGGDEEEPAATQPAPAATTEDPGKKVPAGVTKPGSTIKVGETARVLITPSGAAFDDKTRYEIEASVTEIKKVAVSDLKGVDLDPQQKKATPYFVKLKLTNPGKPLGKDDDPDVKFSAIDDRGQEQSAVIFIGDFPQCDRTDMPKRFGGGKTYETCLVFLIPGGGTIDGVAWTSGYEYVDKPVTWKP